MVSTTRRRTVLALYGVLLVLPTFVFGGLHGHQLLTDQRTEVARVPREVRDAARRLRDTVQREFRALVAIENERPYYQYKDRFFPEDTLGSDLALVPSPLVEAPLPPGILGWFRYDFLQGKSASVELFAGDRTGDPEWEHQAESMYESVDRLVARNIDEGLFARIARMSNPRSRLVPLSFAAINQSEERDIDCMRGELPKLRVLEHERTEVTVFDFHLQLYHEADGTPRILATRFVLMEENPRLASMPPCFANLLHGAHIVQGFFVDPDWLFGAFPEAAAQRVLGEEQFLVPAGLAAPADSDHEVASIDLARELDLETELPGASDFATLHLAVSKEAMEARHRRQLWRFSAVAAMLLLSLATGIALLLRSVQKDLEQARRTENFVAAVTHELRTPVAAIRLYGEMLQDGWAADGPKRGEYYDRIVKEAGRLELLVERVLEKSRLASADVLPRPTDLNAALAPILADLRAAEGPEDAHLAVELAPELPPVLVTPEALRSIVTNLVENARKYAPAARAGEEPASILVRTSKGRGGSVLEVLDRGPGIPDQEKARVFDAFYRIGSEATRSTPGTGLGLHLVRLQARSLGGDVEVLDRPGGGSVFRVSLRGAA